MKPCTHEQDAPPGAADAPRRLRILQVFNEYLKPGGEANSVARIADDLEAAGHIVTRFWRSSKEWQAPGAPPRLRQPLLMWKNPEVLDALRRLHGEVHADLWLFHNVVPVVSLGVYRLARQLDVPVFQWLHNYRPLSPGGTLMAGGRVLQPDDPWLVPREVLHGSWNGRLLTGWLALAYQVLRRRGDFDAVGAWIAISEEMREVFLRGGWNGDRLFALRHAWHLQEPQPADRDEGFFLFLGRMVEPKGVRFLVELWNDPALREIPLVMAGDGPLVDELRAASPPGIRWVGHVDGERKRELLAACRAVLFPALWPEPLGTVAYEAYEFGKPVLGSALGGLKELVLDRQTGLALPPGDAAAWRDAIAALDADTARCWGREGRRWLEANASPQAWNRTFDRIVAASMTPRDGCG